MHRLSSLFLVLLVSALALAPGRASAFPWMIHHGYTGCAQCHVDPSGAGILTDYGRGQSEILLKSNYGKEPKNPEKVSSFLFGAVTLPKQLEVQADVRDIVIPEPGNVRIILMQADARAALAVGPFIASGSIGTVSEGAELAQISSNDTGFKLVSREYWVGAIPTKGLTIRAGRMNLPFGIRTEDHVLFVRSATSTTINDDQQVGLAVAYGNKKMRGEIMGIAGNFQVSPDDFRKRGYSAFFALTPSKKLEIGVSSLFTRSALDTETLAPRTFLSEGLFLRTAPIPPLAIMAEGDVLIDNQDGDRSLGLATTGLLDYEPIQGLHVQGIGQYCKRAMSENDSQYTANLGLQWFFYSRVDVRLDGGYGDIFCTPGSTPKIGRAHV